MKNNIFNIFLYNMVYINIIIYNIDLLIVFLNLYINILLIILIIIYYNKIL